MAPPSLSLQVVFFFIHPPKYLFGLKISAAKYYKPQRRLTRGAMRHMARSNKRAGNSSALVTKHKYTKLLLNRYIMFWCCRLLGAL